MNPIPPTTSRRASFPRRDLLRIGLAGLWGYSWSLPQLLASDATSSPAKDNGISLIYIFLKGGLSTIDTWDMKPNAPSEVRGEFSPIASNVPGIQLGELLPQSSQQMDKYSLLRGFGHRNSDHGPADHYMLTGYHPVAGFNPSLSPNNQRPSFGSIISRKLGGGAPATTSIPRYVTLPTLPNSGGASYLGATCAPLAIEADPASPDFTVPDLVPSLAIRADRVEARRELLQQVDELQRAGVAEANRAANTRSVFRDKAFDLMTSAQAKQAFNIHAEPEKLRDAYGRNTLGQSCLMARRLVEAGVRCVTVEHSNWDTHDGNFSILRKSLLPQLDPAMATLFRDLKERGMWEKTIVLITGEFGRTPRINKNAGRDHWGPSFTVAIGGGGIQGGRVVGSSDELAEKPADKPMGPEDLAATIFHQMGINPQEEFLTPEGRPVKVVNGGKIIRELL